VFGPIKHKHTMKVKLQGSSPYLAKDQAKSDRATCFIGRGSARSSTHAYMLAWGALANKGEYTAQDVVFVSVEGNRGGRIPPNFHEIKKAAIAGVTFITDGQYDRNRNYNVGEREIAQFLVTECGYRETQDGEWKPN
jgi:hypothetical protein